MTVVHYNVELVRSEFVRFTDKACALVGRSPVIVANMVITEVIATINISQHHGL